MLTTVVISGRWIKGVPVLHLFVIFYAFQIFHNEPHASFKKVSRCVLS